MTYLHVVKVLVLNAVDVDSHAVRLRVVELKDVNACGNGKCQCQFVPRPTVSLWTTPPYRICCRKRAGTTSPASRTATLRPTQASRSRTSARSARNTSRDNQIFRSIVAYSRFTTSRGRTRNGKRPFLHENVLLSSNASTRFGASTRNLLIDKNTAQDRAIVHENAFFPRKPSADACQSRRPTSGRRSRTRRGAGRAGASACHTFSWQYHTRPVTATVSRQARDGPVARRGRVRLTGSKCPCPRRHRRTFPTCRCRPCRREAARAAKHPRPQPQSRDR